MNRHVPSRMLLQGLENHDERPQAHSLVHAPTTRERDAAARALIWEHYRNLTLEDIVNQPRGSKVDRRTDIQRDYDEDKQGDYR